MQTEGESGKKWFEGTADAVRQFVWLLEVGKYALILFRSIQALEDFSLSFRTGAGPEA